THTSRRLSVLDRVAGVALILEIVLGLVITVVYGAYAVLTDVGDRYYWGAAMVVGILVAGVAAVTRGWWNGSRFANGGAFAAQMLYGAAGVWLLGTMPALAVALIAAALLVAVAAMRR